MAPSRAGNRRYREVAGSNNSRSPRRSTWLTIAAVVASVTSLALSWLQLQSVQRAVGRPLPDTMIGGYDVDDVGAVRDLMNPAVMERYRSVHYLWDLVFPLAFAALIILLVQRLSRRTPVRWLLYAVAVIYAAVDVAENLEIEAIFASAVITPTEVAFASFLTTAKFVLFAAALLAFALSFMLIRTTGRQDTDG